MNTGGPAFPVPDSHQFNGHPGMTLLDWMAGNEELSDWDIEGAIIPDKLAKHFGGDMPKGGWSENPVAAFERDARIRAGMKYTRASAMLAEKARREADHSGDANKMVPDPFAETTLRRLTADVLPTGIKDAANDQLPSWCAEQVRARVNALEASNRELMEALESLDVWGGELDGNLCPPDSNCSCHISPPCNDCVDFAGQREAKQRWEDAKNRARAAIAKVKGVA